MIHPRAFKEREKKDTLYIQVGGRHLVFQAERRTKLLFSLSEAYFSLVTKNNGLGWEHQHLHSAVTGMDMNSRSVHVSIAVYTDKEEEVWVKQMSLRVESSVLSNSSKLSTWKNTNH